MTSEISIGPGAELDLRASVVRYQSCDRWELSMGVSDGDHRSYTTLYAEDAIELMNWLAQVIPVIPSPCADCRATGSAIAAKGGGDGGICLRCNGSRYIWIPDTGTG